MSDGKIFECVGSVLRVGKEVWEYLSRELMLEVDVRKRVSELSCRY